MIHQLPRYIALSDIERLTGISAAAMRQRIKRGRPTPFAIKFVDGIGYAAAESDVEDYVRGLVDAAPVEGPAAA